MVFDGVVFRGGLRVSGLTRGAETTIVSKVGSTRERVLLSVGCSDAVHWEWWRWLLLHQDSVRPASFFAERHSWVAAAA